MSDTAVVNGAQATEAAPIVIDLGKKKRKLVRQLRKGRGKLIERVNGVVDELRSAGSLAAESRPVIVVVREKKRRRAGLGIF